MRKYDIFTAEMRDLTVGYAKILEIPVNRHGSAYQINTFNMIIDIFWVTAYSTSPTWARYSIALASATALRVVQLNERIEGKMITNPLAYVSNTDNNTLDVYVKCTTQWASMYASVVGMQIEPLVNLVQSSGFISTSELEALSPTYATIKETIPLPNDSRLDEVIGRNMQFDSIYMDEGTTATLQLPNWNGQRQYWVQLKQVAFAEDVLSADIFVTRATCMIELPYDVRYANLLSNKPALWQVGQYATTGEYDPEFTTRICMKKFIDVEPGQEVYFHSQNSLGGFAVRGYDSVGTFVSDIGSAPNGSAKTIPEGVYKISVTLYTTDNSMEYNDFVTALTDGTFNPIAGDKTLLDKGLITASVDSSGLLTINNLTSYGFLFYKIMRSY